MRACSVLHTSSRAITRLAVTSSPALRALTCQCHLCQDHEHHADAGQPWGQPAVQQHYAVVQYICYLDNSASLDSKLRVLASFLDTAQLMDAYTHTALFQWFLYLLQGATFDWPTYSDHLPGAWKLLLQMIMTASPATHETQHTIITLKLDTLVLLWYGRLRCLPCSPCGCHGTCYLMHQCCCRCTDA